MTISSQNALQVHPDQTYLIMYVGGFGGEFMAYWLSQHPGCIKSHAISLQNNRYVHLFDRDFEITASSTCQDRLFLNAHPDIEHIQVARSTDSQNHCYISYADPAYKKSVSLLSWRPINLLNRCYLSCADPAYRKFFFLMSWIKQRLFKFSIYPRNSAVDTSDVTRWYSHPLRQFTDQDFLDKFSKYINYRNWFYQFELDSFNADAGNLDMLTRANKEFRYFEVGHPEYDHLFTINLDLLMFDNSANEHKRICEYFGIDYSQAELLIEPMSQYHQCNLDLYSRYIDLPIDKFIGMSKEQAWPYVAAALDMRHAESVIV
jgi:hypothetical protein